MPARRRVMVTGPGQQLDVALSSSLAFGGNNAVLALRRLVV